MARHKLELKVLREVDLGAELAQPNCKSPRALLSELISTSDKQLAAIYIYIYIYIYNRGNFVISSLLSR